MLRSGPQQARAPPDGTDSPLAVLTGPSSETKALFRQYLGHLLKHSYQVSKVLNYGRIP